MCYIWSCSASRAKVSLEAEGKMNSSVSFRP